MKHTKALIVLSILVMSSCGYYLFVKSSQPKTITQTEPRFDKSPKSIVIAPTPGSTPATELAKIWVPTPQTSWQWQLSTPVDQSIDAQMYDIDMFNNDATTVQALHAKGRHVVCYISAGSVEDWRSDAGRFPSTVIGSDYTGWQGEKWLDIRRIDVLGPIMEKRLDECKAKGFDSVEPDNINGYLQNTGFSLTATDQLTYNIWLANATHKRGLSIGLKEEPDQAKELVAYFDWALDEECFQFGGCEKMEPFIESGKAVFNTEYALNTEQFCASANKLNFNSIKKNKQLDVYRVACR